MVKRSIKVKDQEIEPKGMLDKLGISDADELCAQIGRDFSDSEQVKYLWIPERNQDVKDYFGVLKASEWPFKGASQIKSNFQRIVIDTLTGNLLKSLFLPDKPIKVEPTNSDSREAARYVEDLTNFQAKKEFKLREVLDKAIPTSLIESFCVLHPVYEYLTSEQILKVKRWVSKDVPMDLTYDFDTDTVSDSQGHMVNSIDMEKGYDKEDFKSVSLREVNFEVEKETCTKDGITINVINGYRFYMPVATPGESPWEKVQRAPFVIHQCYYTVREFEGYKEQGYFDDVDPKMDDLYDPQRELISYSKFLQAGFIQDVVQVQTPYINTLKWSGKWKIDGKWRELTVWKDKNSRTILRAELNPFGVRPYIPIVPFPIDDTPYGESLCKIIRPLVQEINLLMRTITNIALMKAAPPKFYDPASGFNPSTVGQFGPNSWIPAREPSRNVLIPPSPEDPGVAFQMLQFIIGIVERITGVNEVIQGQISNRANTTATEVQNATLRAGVRFDTIYERLKNQLAPLFEVCYMLTLRYMPAQKEFTLMGSNKLVMLHKEWIKNGKFNFILSGNSIIQQQNELQNAMALFNTVGQHPYISYKPESIYYLLYNIVKSLNPVFMDHILPTPEEVKTLEREQAKVQTQQEEKAVKASQGNGEAQAAAQQAQMEMQLKATELQMKIKAQEAQLRIDEEEHRMKLRHMEEEHKAKLEMQKELNDAKAKEASRPKPSNSR